MGGGIVAAGREAGPVVEVDDFHVAIGAHDAVAAIDFHVELVGGAGADVLEVALVEPESLRAPVDGFVAILAVSLVKGVEPVKEVTVAQTVELDQVAHQVHINYCARDAAIKVLATGRAHVYKCRYGLCEAVCPLYNFGTLTGYLMMGQVADEGTDPDTLRSALFELSHDFSRINEIVESTPTVKSERISSFVNIMTICAEYMTLANILSSNTPRLPELAKMYLHEKYSEKITIDKMCHTFCCSKSTLLTSFKKEYGRTVIDYLSELRVEEAKKLLASTSLSINEISDATGFYDQSYFSKVFSKEVGLTPSDFRKEMRK